MSAPPSVIDLVERFAHNVAQYRHGDYNETQARREFIDPLFVALGWDVANAQGASPRYQEVIHEYSVHLRGGVRSPDYCFRVGERPKFFVEAKKPSVDIRDDTAPAYQLRRYAWTAKLPLSILTDFEEFSVYEGRRVRPKPSDTAATARVMYLRYDEYADRWDEIAAVFSREAVWRGDYDRYAESTGPKRGTQEVDAAFLEAMEDWRTLLARNIALRNADLSVRELNFCVQKTIDRIIFMRICEDRGIEPYEQLKNILPGHDIYYRLLGLFQRADERYNSGLFHFRPEKDRGEAEDTLTPAIRIDDATLRQIVGALYYPESPYEFSVLGADILGNVYEQFLGSVIRLTPAHRAVVEQKPEVRKAGGVYYTPRYIVDYIVKHTVGALVEGKSPMQLAGSRGRPPLRVLDPACGSGSFLLGAYQYLLQHCLDWYVAHPTQAGRPEVYQDGSAQWHLTTAEKKRILRDHIYGVDIDAQAVEVTKLSLLLKVLQGENQRSMAQQMSYLEAQRALPDLSANIKCGNSLIGPDFYDGQQMALLDDEEQVRINAFDWASEFPEAMAAGGFDAVIGNPPYIRIQAMKQWAPREVEFYKQRYVAASKGNYDIYVVFVERGLSLLRDEGLLGFILPHKFFNAQYGEPLRGLIAEGKHLAEVVHFGDQQVFAGATTYTCLMVLSSNCQKHVHVRRVSDLAAWRTEETCIEGLIDSTHISGAEWNLVVGPGSSLYRRLSQDFTKLGEVAAVFVGLQTSADAVYVLEAVERLPQSLSLRSKSLGSTRTFERTYVHPLVSGTDVSRYAPMTDRQYIIFPYDVQDREAILVSISDLQQRVPLTAQYLLENRSVLEARERGKFKGQGWHRFGRNQNIGIQEQRKLCIPRLVEHLYVAFDGEGEFYLDNVDVCGITLRDDVSELGLLYLMGLLNSRLLRWHFPFVSAPFRGGWLSANRQFVEKLPIRTIDFTNPADVARHDRMVALVSEMLALHERLAAARMPRDKTMLQRRIDTLDRQIDALVYELYALSDDEIAIVEAAT